MNESRPGYGPFQQSDSRIPKMLRESMIRDPLSPFRPAADPYNSLSRLGARDKPVIVSFGKVNQAIPFFGWYKVELDGNQGSLGCYRIKANGSPLSGIDFESILPGQRVLVMHWPGAIVGSIIGVAPASLYDAWVYRPDWILQGAGTGAFRNSAHHQGIKLKRNGGVLDFSSGAPVDSNLLDRGTSFPTGMMFLLNPFLSMLRASDICGLWINRIDHAARLAGKNLEIFSSAELLEHGKDNKEHFGTVKLLVYPWEAEGQLITAVDASVITSDNDVWYKTFTGTVDRDPADAKVKPFARRTRYVGYLGQGGFETISAPAPGKTKNDETHNPIGLASISQGLEGSLNFQSAHSIGLFKHLIVGQPQRILDPADPAGDTKDNYKANGQTGSGPAHLVKDAIDPTSPNADDELAYITAWKMVHPFYYHKKDFRLPNDSESFFERSQEKVSYDPIASGQAMDKAQPVQCRIDHRYGNVGYYRRSSFIMLRPDGSVDQGDGSGAYIGMRNGKILLHAPDGLEIITGGRSVWMGGELAVNMHGSIDMSSANADFRIAAPKGNLQAVGDSVLIESLDTDGGYQFKDQVGEDVQSTGITFKSKTNVVSWSDNFYLRSGMGTNKQGDIVLDAGKRKNSLVIHARQTTMFTESGLNMWIGGANQDTFDTFHLLGKNACEIGTKLVVDGSVAVVGDNPQMLVSGPIYSAGTISAAGKMADVSGGILAKVPDDFKDRLTDQKDKIEKQLEGVLEEAAQTFQDLFPDGWYAEERAGNDDLIGNAGFSYRDDDDQVQYGSAAFLLDEPRWQRWLRLGLATGGKSWQQESISYQGKDLFPYPGRKAWSEKQTFQQTNAADILDFANGRSADRTDTTGNAKPGDSQRVTMLGAFKVMIG